MVLSADPGLRRAARAAFAIALLVVFGGSLVPGIAVSLEFSLPDKILHFCGYLSLGFLSGIGWIERRSMFAVVLPLIGLALEIAQIYVPGRGFDWFDAAANSLGAVLGVALSGIIRSQVTRAG